MRHTRLNNLWGWTIQKKGKLLSWMLFIALLSAGVWFGKNIFIDDPAIDERPVAKVATTLAADKVFKSSVVPDVTAESLKLRDQLRMIDRVQLVEVDGSSADAVAPPASESLYVPARAGEVLLVFLPDGWGDLDNNDNGYLGSLRTVTDGSELVLGRAYGGDVSWTEAPENYFCLCSSDDDKISRSHVKLVSRDGSAARPWPRTRRCVGLRTSAST